MVRHSGNAESLIGGSSGANFASTDWTERQAMLSQSQSSKHGIFHTKDSADCIGTNIDDKGLSIKHFMHISDIPLHRALCARLNDAVSVTSIVMTTTCTDNICEYPNLRDI